MVELFTAHVVLPLEIMQPAFHASNASLDYTSAVEIMAWPEPCGK